MTDSLGNVFLEHLSVIRGDIAAIKEDISETKNHLTTIESGVAEMRSKIAAITLCAVGKHVGPTA